MTGASWAIVLVVGAVGVIVIAGLAAMIDQAIRVRRLYRGQKRYGAMRCPACGFSRIGSLAAPRCPECGVPLPEIDQRLHGRVPRDEAQLDIQLGRMTETESRNSS